MVAILVLPGFMIYIMMQPIEVLKEPQFEKRWGTLYEGFRVVDKWTLSCNLLFMIRRVIFVVIAFNMDATPSI